MPGIFPRWKTWAGIALISLGLWLAIIVAIWAGAELLT